MTRTLIKAIQNGEETLAKDIIQCGTYGVPDSQTKRVVDTALFICCSRGFLELAQLLLDKGANVATTDKNLATPLHGAVDNGHVDLVRLLINRGADINAQNNRGDTPLHLATYRGHGEITRCLMEAGADYRLVNTKFFTAENEAVVQGHKDVVTYLRSEQNGGSSNAGERNGNFLDSMIRLDAPSVIPTPDVPSHPPATDKQQTKHLHPSSEQQKHHSDFHVKKYDSYFSHRPDAIDIEMNQLRNLSCIVLDPPEGFFPASKCISPCYSTRGPKCGESSSNIPTFCSTCNSVSDIPVLTCSDAISVNNNRSGVLDNVCDYRCKDTDLQDEKLVNRYADPEEENVLLSSLGVRNPPVNKQFSQLTTNSGATCSSDYSDMYDSTLFSLRSVKYGSLLPPQSRTATESLDYASSEEEECCKTPGYFENNRGLKFNYAYVENGSLSFTDKPLNALEWDSDYSACFKTDSLLGNNSRNRLHCGFTRMASNDLSSPFSLREKSFASMTCVNIAQT